MWYDYGTFCLRTAKQGQAEQCLKEAVAVEPGHKAALLALAALLWHVGLHTDAAYLDQAETVLHAAKEVAADDAAVWALLSLVYESMASRRVSEHRNAAFEMRRLGKVHNRRSLAGNPYLQVNSCSLHPCSLQPPLSVCELPHSLVSCKLVARSCAEQSLQGSFSALVSVCNAMTSSIISNAKHHQALCYVHVALMISLQALHKRSSNCGITVPSSAISIPFLTRAPACSQCSTLPNSVCLAYAFAAKLAAPSHQQQTQLVWNRL